MQTPGLSLAARIAALMPLAADRGELSAMPPVNTGFAGAPGGRTAEVASIPSRAAPADELGEADPLLARVTLVASQASPAPVVTTGLSVAGPAIQIAGAIAEASAPASRPEATARQPAEDAAPRTLRSIDIQLQPIDLGRVNARLTLVGGQLAVELRVETAEAYRQLSSDSESIVKSLKAAGYEVERVTVQQLPTAAPTSPSADRGGGQPGFQERTDDRTGDDAGRGASGQRGDHQEGGAGRNEGSDRDPGRGGVYI